MKRLCQFSASCTLAWALLSGTPAHAGVLLWQAPVTHPIFQQISPAMVAEDILGDAEPEIIVGHHGGIYVYTADGQLLPDYPVTAPPKPGLSFRWGPQVPPRIGDVNGDGTREFVYVETAYRRIVVMDFDGNVFPGFPIDFVPQVWGTNTLTEFYLTLADVNGDGADEIFVPSGNLSKLRVFGYDGSGQPLPGWPVVLTAPPPPPGNLPWGDFVISGLSSADIEGDGMPEIFCSFRMYSGGTRFGGVWGIRGDGTVLPGWPQLPIDGGGAGALIFTDVDGNLEPDLLHTGEGRVQQFLPDGTWFQRNFLYNNASGRHMAGTFGGDFHAIVLALEVLLFPVPPPGPSAPTFPTMTDTTDDFEVYIGGSVGDTDGDGSQEIAVWTLFSDLGASTGMYLHLLDENLQNKPGWPKLFTPYLNASHANYATVMVDLDGDGDCEIVHSYNDQLYAWDQPPIGTTPAKPLWPMRTYDVKASYNQWQDLAHWAAYLRGDADRSGGLDLGDVVTSLGYLFTGAQVPCPSALDVDDAGSVNLGDPILLLSYLFASGAPPVPPHPACEKLLIPADGLGCSWEDCP